MEKAEYYYRANASSIFTECGLGTETSIYFETYLVEKRTPKGAWIRRRYETRWSYQEGTELLGYRRHFVLDDARKKFAYPTKDEALVGYKKRTGRYIQILESKLLDAKAGYEAALAGRVSEEAV